MGRTQSNVPRSFHVVQKVLHGNRRVSQCALERVAIHLVMEGEDDATSIGVFHLEVASLAVNLDESEALKCGEHLSPR